MLKPAFEPSWRWAACVACVLLGIAEARSHTLPISQLTLAADADYLHAELVLNPFELTVFSELDVNRNGRLDLAEFNAHETTLTRRITQALMIVVDGNTVIADVAGMTPDSDSHHLLWRAHYRVDARAAAVRVESTLNVLTSGSHLTQVTLRRDERRQTAQLDAHSRRVFFEAPYTLAAGPRAVAQPRINQTAAWIVLVCAGVPATLLCMAGALLFGRTRHSSGPAR